MNDHRKLKAFELADDLVVSVYHTTTGFPSHEQFGLTSQMRRAAVSVAANIVEGCGRQTRNDYLHFLTIALGSLREVGYYIDLSARLGFLEQNKAGELSAQYNEAARVLVGLIVALKKSQTS